MMCATTRIQQQFIWKENGMAKHTITGRELGCSELPPLVLRKTAFQTRQQVWDKQWKANAGVESIERIYNQHALDRGNFLQDGIADWALHELQKKTTAHLTQFEPQDAFRLKDVKLGATLDNVISIEGGVLPLEHDGIFYEFEGDINHETKTDFYHNGVCKPDWIIQCNGQMLCSGLRQTIVSVLAQDGKLHLYPVIYDEQMAEKIVQLVDEFWVRIEKGENYPDLEEESAPDYVDLTEHLNKTNKDLDALCDDLVKVRAESNALSKQGKEIQAEIVGVLESLGVTHGKTEAYELVSEFVTKPKKKMVDTGETQESQTFKIKERKD